MAYEAMREVGDGWSVLHDRDADVLRVSCRGEVLIDGVPSSSPWGRALRQATGEDLDALLVAREMSPGLTQEGMLHLIAHAVGVRTQASREGFQVGMRRARLEAATAMSGEFAQLRMAAREIMDCPAAGMDSCPWFVGLSAATGRRAAKMVFLYPWNLDRTAHGEIVEAARQLGMPLSSRPNATGLRTQHVHVLAPTATWGTDPRSETGVVLAQDSFRLALSTVGLHREPDGRLGTRPVLPKDQARQEEFEALVDSVMDAAKPGR